MLLLVTLALVVASAALLILGFVQDALGFIYLSMLCAGVAALALFVFARLARRRSAVLAGAGVVGSAPAGDSRPTTRNRAVAPSGGQVQSGVESEPTGAVAIRTEVEPRPRSFESQAPLPSAGEDEADRFGAGDDAWRPRADTAVHPVVGAAPMGAPGGADDQEGAWSDQDEEEWADWDDEVVFPIEDYDELRVAEILPLLGQLEADELQEVRDRELAGKARATVLDRIDDRLGRSSRPARQASTPAAAPHVPDAVDEAGPEDETPAPAPSARGRSASTPAAGKSAAPARKAAAGKTGKAATPAPRPARKATGATPAKKAAAARAAIPEAGAPEAGDATTGPVPARRTAARKTAAKETPVKKTAAKKATTKKAAPARAAGAKRAAAASEAAPVEAPAAAPTEPPVDQVPAPPRRTARKAPAKKTS